MADQRLCACDELRMAATQLQLPTPSEMLEEQDIPFVVPVFEVGGAWVGFGWSFLEALELQYTVHSEDSATVTSFLQLQSRRFQF